MNADGRERYLGQLQHLTGKVSSPDFQAMEHRGLWSAGRGNHYLFDLNRDWLMQVHPETRGRAAAILAANPHLVVDFYRVEHLAEIVDHLLVDGVEALGTVQRNETDRSARLVLDRLVLFREPAELHRDQVGVDPARLSG